MAKVVDSQCRAFQHALDVLSRPWSALILNVLQAGPLRFCELAETAHGPGDKVLSARLKDLEAKGLVERHVASGPPVRVSYELTQRGREFNTVATAVEKWGRCLVGAASATRTPKLARAPRRR
jgi:DNA-binding HxlR family transcriptional regulator